jgi:hypothetical protein
MKVKVLTTIALDIEVKTLAELISTNSSFVCISTDASNTYALSIT